MLLYAVVFCCVCLPVVICYDVLLECMIVCYYVLLCIIICYSLLLSCVFVLSALSHLFLCHAIIQMYMRRAI